MGLVLGLLGTIVTLCVLALCVIGAIWESVRFHKEFKKLERQSRPREEP